MSFQDHNYAKSSRVSSLKTPCQSHAQTMKNGTPVDDGPEIDTKHIAESMKSTLIRLEISQKQFASNVINRSKQTLSDMLKKPIPWQNSKLAGKTTWRLMAEWLDLSDEEKKLVVTEKDNDIPSCSTSNKKATDTSTSAPKEEKFVFPKVHEASLEAVFKECPRPSTEVMQQIAIDMKLELSTIQNFFANARRRNGVKGKRMMRVEEEEESKEESHDDPQSPPGPSPKTPKDNKISVDDGPYIDTTKVAKSIESTLLNLEISQEQFAWNVIDRSQGTLSYLLKNPKPWEELKAGGKTTWRLMADWLKLTDNQKKLVAEKKVPTRKTTNPVKKTKFVFSPVQRSTLVAFFKENRRPSLGAKETIAGHLGLELSTVENFFANARRRNGHGSRETVKKQQPEREEEEDTENQPLLKEEEDSEK